MLPIPAPTQIVEATIERLQTLTTDQGRYIRAIEKAAGPIDKMDQETMQKALHDLAGQAPAVLIALDKIANFTAGTNLDTWECEAELVVYGANDHRTSLTHGRLDPDDRTGADPTRDPGLRAMYMDLFERLAGWAPPSSGPLEPVTGATVAVWQSATVWSWRFMVRLTLTSSPDDKPTDITSARARIEAQTPAGEPALVIDEDLP